LIGTKKKNQKKDRGQRRARGQRMEQVDLERRVQIIEEELRSIQARNKRVELEKAWEVSATRKVAVLILTYVIASIVLYLIDVQEFWLAAIIPTVGYLLSTLSVSWLKSRWLTDSH
jgi:hypothetical protein